MDEWYVNGKELDATHPISFEKADRDLCFNRMEKKYRIPDSNLHFPKADTREYIKSWESGIRCAVMQGGQGDTKHWAFNDPFKREGKYKDAPPSPEEFRKLTTRVVDLHPITCHAECTHKRRRSCNRNSDAGSYCRSGSDMDGRKSINLACRNT